MPSVPMQRRMELGDVVKARYAQEDRVSWCAIFLKAYSIVSANHPELRRSYMPFPWPHLYEHPINVGSFTVERRYRKEEGVFCVQVPQPELLSLRELDETVRYYKTVSIKDVPSFNRALRLSWLPLYLRRSIWWLALYADGTRRADIFGTFCISVVASLGGPGLHVLSPLTTTLNYGTFEPNGTLDVRLVYDHRVIDGANMARIMSELEEVLHGPILNELLANPSVQSDDNAITTSIVEANNIRCREPLLAADYDKHQKEILT